MPFNKDTDSQQLISKDHKRMLRIIAKSRGVFMRKIVENFIEKEYAKVVK